MMMMVTATQCIERVDGRSVGIQRIVCEKQDLHMWVRIAIIALVRDVVLVMIVDRALPPGTGNRR